MQIGTHQYSEEEKILYAIEVPETMEFSCDNSEGNDFNYLYPIEVIKRNFHTAGQSKCLKYNTKEFTGVLLHPRNLASPKANNNVWIKVLFS